ncbi:hypothetical protein MLD38_026300 [Melastoma candidum]|nr:hypothetical protein MLD38_026300 [Melastoma candidum]
MMMRRTSTRHNGSVQGSGDADEPMPVSMQDKASMRRHGSTRTGSMRCDSSRALGRSESSLLGKDDLPYSDPDLIGSESGRFPRRGTNNYSDDRLISAREAAAAQEASEAEAAAAAAAAAREEEEEEEEENGGLLGEEKSEEQPERFSLMDLLEQTDEQMGWSGSSYMMRDEDEDEDEEEEEEEVEEERSCTVCQVKHKGARSGPCGHSFCRLCSKELRVGNGNCPACNDFNLEIVQVF